MQQGQILAGRYQISKGLQTGQLCQTYLAQDLNLPDAPFCIIKKLHPQSNEATVIKTAQRLFKREVKVLNMLGKDHDQIPRLLDHISENQDFYLVQEYIDGESLDKEIFTGQHHSEPQAIALLHQVLEILVFVHQHDVIHRDIKPSNLMRRKSDGKLVLIDFGAVKQINKMGSGSSGQTNFTVVGTLGYAPKEQDPQGDPCKASDIYALGMTVIFALTGVLPRRLRRDNTNKLNWRDLPHQASPDLADILDKMVCSDVRDRYQTVDEVLQDLQPLLPYGPTAYMSGPTTRRTLVKQVLLSVVLLVGLGAFFVVPRVLSAFQALQLYDRSRELISAGSYQEAIATLDRALEIKPDFVQALTDRGYVLGQQGRYLEKFSTCDRAVNIDPRDPEAWVCRGLAQFGLDKYKDAISDYNSALAIDGTYVRAWYNKGDALLELKRYDQAIAHSDTILDIDRDYFLAWYQKCKVFNRQQHFQKALESCDRALEMEPDHQETIKLRNWILQQQSQQK